MKYLLLFFLTFNAQAALKVENGTILPFKLQNHPLKGLVKDYSELMNLTVSFPSDMFRENETLNLEINSKMTKEDFQTILFNLLDDRGYTAIEQNGIFWIYSAKDIRYTPSPLTQDNNFPADARFRTAVYKLKYPISSFLARNLRPVMSRYGRIIDLSDARTIIINDTSENLKRLSKTISFMDVEATYKNFVNDIPKQDPDAFDPTNSKIIELETEKKILEKKYMELKEKEAWGANK